MWADFSIRLIRVSVFLLLGYAASGCSSTEMFSDYDREADFGTYTTYDFIDGAGSAPEGYDSLFSKYMIAAITIEMENRGYVKSASPDLWVNFSSHLEDKTTVTQTTSAQPYYGYRRGRYGSWGAYGYGTDTHVSQYTEGTFGIDIIDARRKQLVWEAVGVGKIDDKKLQNMERSVNEG
ncbi:MAG: DUF4136 domain-containing protein, partial [Gammaproteobacteria bacterium]